MNKIKIWLPLLVKYKYIFDAANVLTILSKKNNVHLFLLSKNIG